MRQPCTKGVAIVAMLLTAPLAAGHSDILVRSDGAKVQIGAAVDLSMEEGGPFFDLETSVFEGVLLDPATPTPPFGYDFERDEPGFYSNAAVPVGQNLPATADLTLKLHTFSLPSGTDAAFYWDGVGDVDFVPLSTAQPGVAFTFAPMAPDAFASTDGSSAVDDHPLFGLTGGAADGVYLAQMRLDVEGLATSDPFTMVWLASSALTTESLAEELEEALEAFEEGGSAPVVAGVDFSFFEEAVEFAETIPEPSAGLLLLVGTVALAATRRRRHA